MPKPSIKFPLILVNLKTYPQSTGAGALHIARLAEEASHTSGICIAVAPQAVDLQMVAKTVDIPVFAQHVDPITPGRNTGHMLPEAVYSAGATGTLISHSERRLELEAIKSRITRAKDVGLVQVVCVDTVERGRKVAPFHPDAVAIEPPELIGTGIPVSKANPTIVSDSVKAVTSLDTSIKVLCGAGITSGEDVSSAMKLGVKGILVASGVVKSNDPQGKMLELAEAIR